jgi:toxin ParE1/3/4
VQKKIAYHPEAETEIIESAEWYENQRLGLGDEFLDEIENAISRILSSPDAFG